MRKILFLLLFFLSFCLYGDDDGGKRFNSGDRVYYDCVSDDGHRQVIGGIVKSVGSNGAVMVAWDGPNDCSNWVGELNLWSSREELLVYSSALSKHRPSEKMQNLQQKAQEKGLGALSPEEINVMATEGLTAHLGAMVPVMVNALKELEKFTDEQIQRMPSSDKQKILTSLSESRELFKGEPVFDPLYKEIFKIEQRFKVVKVR